MKLKTRKEDFLICYYVHQVPKFLGYILAGKGVIAKRQVQGINRAGEGIVTASYGNKKKMLPHPLTDFEVQKYYQNKPRSNGVYSRDNQPKIKDWAYIIHFDEYSDIGTHWVALCVQNNDVTYFHSFRVEHIPKETKTFIGPH